MSEIKGQLLGIVLVVAVFGVVGGVLVTAFSASAEKIQTKIETDTEPTVIKKENNNFIISNDELLTF